MTPPVSRGRGKGIPRVTNSRTSSLSLPVLHCLDCHSHSHSHLGELRIEEGESTNQEGRDAEMPKLCQRMNERGGRERSEMVRGIVRIVRRGRRRYTVTSAWQWHWQLQSPFSPFPSFESRYYCLQSRLLLQQ